MVMDSGTIRHRKEVIGRIDYARYQQNVPVTLLCNLLNITPEQYESALYDKEVDPTPAYAALTTSALNQIAALLELKPAWLAFGGWGQIG